MAPSKRKNDTMLEQAGHAMIGVGGARGFIVASPARPHQPLVVTAAHCLPNLPPPHLASYTHERTYAKLLGPLDAQPTVWAECVFADAVADLAVLSSPDTQALYEEAEVYEALVEPITPMRIRAAKVGLAWVQGLDGRWFRCDVEDARSPLWIKPTQPIVGGMSGSPIVQSGAAVGVVSTAWVAVDLSPAGIGRTDRLAAGCLSLDLPRRLFQRRPTTSQSQTGEDA